MYLIQKCLIKNIDAAYSLSDRNLWIAAWKPEKTYINECNADKAIAIFEEKTARVKNTPYRLLDLENMTVIA